jgi:hypothetical protein
MGGDKEMDTKATILMLEERRMNGEKIADTEGWVQRADGKNYRVHSQTSDRWYAPAKITSTVLTSCMTSSVSMSLRSNLMWTPFLRHAFGVSCFMVLN